jgi:glycosyltransferase involved in cell wall biosynthesis
MTCVGFCLPNLDAGGIERVVLNLLLHLDRGRFRPVLLLSRAEGLLLPQVPGDVEVLTLGGGRARFAGPAIASRVREAGVDVLYSGTNAVNLAAVTASLILRRRVPVIVSEHTPPGIFLDEAKWRSARIALMRLAYPMAATVAVPLAQIGDELRAILKLPGLSISVLPNPVLRGSAAGLKDAEPEVDLPEGAAPTLVSSGRLVPAKGFDVLLRALAEVRLGGGPPNLLVLGEGPELGRLEALAAELGIADRVTFAGTVDNPLAVISRAAAFVLSSRREGFGNVMIEAMACGVPVIAADCPFGPRMNLRDGEAGMLVRPDDPGALARGIEKLLGNKSLARKYTEAGAKVAAEYTADRTVPAFEELFLRLADR